MIYLRPCPNCDSHAELIGTGMANCVYSLITTNRHYYFTDFYGYKVKCQKCDTETKICQTTKEAMNEWNNQSGSNPCELLK